MGQRTSHDCRSSPHQWAWSRSTAAHRTGDSGCPLPHTQAGGESSHHQEPAEGPAQGYQHHSPSKHEHHRSENLGHLYSQTPSKHSIARPLTERQQGVIAAQVSPSLPQVSSFGGGGGPLPPHPRISSARTARTTNMLRVAGRSPRPCAAYTPQRSRHGGNTKGRHRASGTGRRSS